MRAKPSFLFSSGHDQIKIRIAYDVGYMHRVRKLESKGFSSKDQGLLCVVKFSLEYGNKRKPNDVIVDTTVLREPPHNIDCLTDIKKSGSKSNEIYSAALL